MFREALVCSALLASVKCNIPTFTFCISSLKNDTGEWYSEVRFNHQGEQPWDVYVDQTTIKLRDSESVAIVAKISPPKATEHLNPSHVPDKSNSNSQGNSSVTEHFDHSYVPVIVNTLQENSSLTEHLNPSYDPDVSNISKGNSSVTEHLNPSYVPDVSNISKGNSSVIDGKVNPELKLATEKGHYKLHNWESRRTWQEAEKICKEEGAHLLILNSEAEVQAIKKLMGEHKSLGYLHWVGVHDHYSEGTYVTLLNETLESTGFNKWWPSSPVGGTERNCVWFLHDTDPNEYGLSDWDCDWQMPFICEMGTNKLS